MSKINKIVITGLAAIALGISGANASIQPFQNAAQRYDEPLIEIYQAPELENLVQSEQTQNNMAHIVGVPGVVKNETPAIQPTKIVYLTFDDGGYYYWDTLRILNEKNAKATFCLVGYFMEQNPDFVRNAVASGDVICNHTYDHPHLSSLSNEQIAWELNKADIAYDSIINPNTGGDTTKPWMRLPYEDGARDLRVLSVIRSLGYNVVKGTVDADSHNIISAAAIEKNVLSHVGNGSTVIFHMIDPALIDALPVIIDQLSNQGYYFATFNG
jgi:peptidoglycan/xylan/chitin deacetylase (PgdA/CDA1 family)